MEGNGDDELGKWPGLSARGIEDHRDCDCLGLWAQQGDTRLGVLELANPCLSRTRVEDARQARSQWGWMIAAAWAEWLVSRAALHADRLTANTQVAP